VNLKEKERKRDLQEVLSTIEGRRFLWGQLGKCKVYESIWESSAKIHYNAGKQDLGHELMREILDASPEAYLQMQKESMESNKGS
jgi:hypothetical protein